MGYFIPGLSNSISPSGHFIPVRDMPLMNCFWNAMSITAEGTIIIADAAIVADRSVECYVEK